MSGRGGSSRFSVPRRKIHACPRLEFSFVRFTHEMETNGLELSSSLLSTWAIRVSFSW